MKKLFVLGCGRSGTTMLQQALNRHSRIAIPPETGFFIDFLGHTRMGQAQHIRRINADLGIDLPAPPKRITRRDEVLAFYEQLATRYLGRIGRTEVEYFGEKSPRHLLQIRRIVRYFPAAKYLLIYRDGRDVALSLTGVPWGPSDFYVNFAIWLRFYRWHQWATRQESIDLLCVKYEDLTQQPEKGLRRVADFLDVEYEPAMADAYGNPEGVTEREREWKARALEQINTSRIALWRTELSDERIRHLERWGGPALASLGYELSTDRRHRLPWHFFPRLYWKHTIWRLGCAWRLAAKNLLAK